MKIITTLSKAISWPFQNRRVLTEQGMVDSTWYGTITFRSGSVYDVELVITHSGQAFNGSLLFKSGRHEGNAYFVSGRIQDEVFTFQYFSQDKKAKSQGTAVFQFETGTSLSGHYLFFSEDADQIDVANGKFCSCPDAERDTGSSQNTISDRKYSEDNKHVGTNQFQRYYPSICDIYHW